MYDIEKTKIVISAHKKNRMPKSRIYLPLHVGAAGKEAIGYERDDSGENISRKNLSILRIVILSRLTKLSIMLRNISIQLNQKRLPP